MVSFEFKRVWRKKDYKRQVFFVTKWCWPKCVLIDFLMHLLEYGHIANVLIFIYLDCT